MWNGICIALLAAELILLTVFIIGRIQQKKLHETIVFFCAVAAVGFILQLIPCLHSFLVEGSEDSLPLALLSCLTDTVKLFVFDINTDAAQAFSRSVPLFSYTYALGAVLAVLTTLATALDVFHSTISNSLRRSKAMKAPVCDMVIGSDERALQYAKASGAVLLLEDGADKQTAKALMEEGYTVLPREFSAGLLSSRYFGTKTRYNIICPAAGDRFLGYIDDFLTYKSEARREKNIYLYPEIPRETAVTVSREMLEKSGYSAYITTFCSQELFARAFTEEHPITRYLKADFLAEDASLQPDKQLNVLFLGFGSLSQALYRQSLLHNQLVSFVDGTYKVHPVNYCIFDTQAEETEWNIQGLENALNARKTRHAEYFPMPELPYRTQAVKKAPWSIPVQEVVEQTVCQAESFSFIIIDTGDNYRDMDLGARLRAKLLPGKNFHIFVRSDVAYAKSSDMLTYYGDLSGIFTHENIVNDGLSAMAKAVNAIYGGWQPNSEEAEQSWKELDDFTRYSNICAAENLRVKLNLLGLDYVKDGEAAGTGLLAQAYPERNNWDYSQYFQRSKHCAMLAQEHARWNASLLLEEFLPLEKSNITVKIASGDTVRFQTKDVPAKKHACLTTFQGLDHLSAYLASLATQHTGKDHAPGEYDYYTYDDMLLRSAAAICDQLGYSIVEKTCS